MHVDIALYEKSRPLAIDWFESNGKDVSRTIGYMAALTFIPAIVVAYWLGAHLNWRQDTVDSIRRLQNFYDYSSIENKPDGAPL